MYERVSSAREFGGVCKDKSDGGQHDLQGRAREALCDVRRKAGGTNQMEQTGWCKVWAKKRKRKKKQGLLFGVEER